MIEQSKSAKFETELIEIEKKFDKLDKPTSQEKTITKQENVEFTKINEPIPLPPRLMQDCHVYIGKGLGTYMGNNMYFYNQVINVLIPYLEQTKGEGFIKKNYPSYDPAKVERWTKRLQKIKIFYDALENKTLKKENKEKELWKIWRESISRLPLIYPDFWGLYVFLVKSTTLQRQSIKSQYIKVIEHAGYKTLKLGDKKKEEDKK